MSVAKPKDMIARIRMIFTVLSPLTVEGGVVDVVENFH